MARVEPYSPFSTGVPRVYGRRVFSGIAYVLRNALQSKDASKDYGPHNTLYNRLALRSRLGVFDGV
ncbi:transposase [Rhizobium halophytocola]|uniref:transposase n=1 Tax=Rhizobium halophytocola TaxID=735519 RepID=UPI001AE2A9F3